MGAHPAQQGAVAAGGGGEIAVAEVAAEVVDDRGVVGVAVGVDSARDRAVRERHAEHRCTCSARTGWVQRAAAGSVDTTVMGASRTGSYEVTPPGRTRAGGVTTRADYSCPGQQTSRQSPEGPTRAATPPAFSYSLSPRWPGRRDGCGSKWGREARQVGTAVEPPGPWRSHHASQGWSASHRARAAATRRRISSMSGPADSFDGDDHGPVLSAHSVLGRSGGQSVAGDEHDEH